ncbi:MAG: IS30 family transposase, partial [Bacillota bacterium]
LADHIEEKIKNNYSPEVIANEIKEMDEFEINIQYKTIYNYIDKGIGPSNQNLKNKFKKYVH